MTNTEFEAFHFTSDDGLQLYGRAYGNKSVDRPIPIVCLAGLSRNSRDFHPLALRLSAVRFRVITLDYRGRGLSDRDPEKANYTIVREARDVIAGLDHLGIDKAMFIGTSRGGLILHILAATAAERLAAIVLNDIGPVIEIEGLRRIRDYLSVRTAFDSLDEAADRLAQLHGKEFPDLRSNDWSEMAEALYRRAGTKWEPDFDPALVEPLRSMDFSAPLTDLWPQFDGISGKPLLVVRGANSQLLSQETVAEMLNRHRKAETVTAEGQGHAPLLHKDDIYQPLLRFLDDLK
uniref:alpha/beta fold hydrolase n=1 Tax=uncultured Rhizobium sp. TaxID=155567 RepID=UPI0026143D82|nr:alpha/beta hydrolase [uncultured Rhizobium sp.]